MPFLKKGKEIPTGGKGSVLTAKMTRFIDEFFVDMNGSEAAKRAGYSHKNVNRTATSLLNHPLIKKEMDRRMDKKRQNSEVRAEYLINKLLKIIENTEEDNPQAALRAIELAGKSIALWKERQEISGPDGGAIETKQRIEEDAADFSRRMARLSAIGGAGTVSKFPKSGSEGSS